MATTSYTLDCCDEHGNPIGKPTEIGPSKNRIFDPTDDPRYASTIKLPSKIVGYNASLQLTQLSFADGYKPNETDVFITFDNGIRLQQHTMVVEVGAVVREGFVVAARTYGVGSMYNQPGMPMDSEEQSPTAAIARIIDIGCQNIEGIVERHPFIKEVIFATSDTVIFEAISNLEEWLRTGIPEDFKSLDEMDLQFLHTNISYLEAKNVKVMVWSVKPEHILGPYWTANGLLDDLEGIPMDETRCTCPNCIGAEQSREATFARKGKEPCPCPPCRELVAKYGHLKKGETFPLTNLAGVNAVLVMATDGPNAAQGGDQSNKD